MSHVVMICRLARLGVVDAYGNMTASRYVRCGFTPACLWTVPIVAWCCTLASEGTRWWCTSSVSWEPVKSWCIQPSLHVTFHRLLTLSHISYRLAGHVESNSLRYSSFQDCDNSQVEREDSVRDILPIQICKSAYSASPSLFSWQWHSIVMATGACSSLMQSFPYGTGSFGLQVMTLAFFLLDLVFFLLLCVWAVLRCTMFPEVFGFTPDHGLLFVGPLTSLYLGSCFHPC